MPAGPKFKRGCVFFNFGTAYAVRLLVAIFSLRKHYTGPITVFLAADATSTELKADIERLGAEVVTIDSLSKSFDRHRLFLESPYQSTLALDSDLIFRAPIDPLWEPLEQSGVLLTRFHAPPFGVDGTPERPGFGNRVALLAGIRRLIDKDLHERTVRRMLEDRIDINIGVMGISQPTGSAFLADLAAHLERGRPHRIPLLDEMLVVALAGRHPHRLVDETWNCPADEFFRRTNLADARVIHYFAEGQAVHGIPLGRNPNTWAGKKWLGQFHKATAQVSLDRWMSFDPAFAR